MPSTTAPSTTALITTADRSVKTLQAAIAQLLKTSTELSSLGTIIETQSADIQQNDSRLANIDAEFELKERTAAANLNVAVLENEDLVMKSLMAKRNLATVTTDELTNLAKELQTAQADNQAAIDTAVAAASKELNASWGAKLGAVENAHKVETATLKAEATSKDERISFLTGEIAALRNQIEAERNTRLEIAKADAGRQGVVVNAGKQ